MICINWDMTSGLATHHPVRRRSGRERVIAGTDCGFGTSGAGDEVHPDVAWAKLRALVEGARLASQRLF